jgi:hypothetical protein
MSIQRMWSAVVKSVHVCPVVWYGERSVLQFFQGALRAACRIFAPKSHHAQLAGVAPRELIIRMVCARGAVCVRASSARATEKCSGAGR